MTNKEKLVKRFTSKISRREPNLDFGIVMKRWRPKTEVRVDVPDCSYWGNKENRLIDCIERRNINEFRVYWFAGPNDSYTAYANINRFKVSEIEKLAKFF